MLAKYYWLCKPGIVYGNTITAAAGFLFAAGTQIEWRDFFALVAGIALVIAAACVFNNILDRGMDAKMARTKRRALVEGTISKPAAVAYGAVLLAAGFAVLGFYTNELALLTALLGFLVYVGLYTPAKRFTTYATEIGSIAGAVPITAGYVAARGEFDLGALLVFLALTFWQMPHFYAIAVRRQKEYAAASVPVLPIVHGIVVTKRRTLVYIGLFMLTMTAFYVMQYAGYTFLLGMVILSGMWLMKGFRPFSPLGNIAWARQLFKFSMTVLLAFSVLLSTNSFLV